MHSNAAIAYLMHKQIHHKLGKFWKSLLNIGWFEAQHRYARDMYALFMWDPIRVQSIFFMLLTLFFVFLFAWSFNNKAENHWARCFQFTTLKLWSTKNPTKKKTQILIIWTELNCGRSRWARNTHKRTCSACTITNKISRVRQCEKKANQIGKSNAKM